MADYLAICGSPAWVEHHTLDSSVDDVCINLDGWGCRIGFRSGVTPWPGDWVAGDRDWCGWLGDPRAVDGVPKCDVRRRPGDVLASLWRSEGMSGLEKIHGPVAGFYVDRRAGCLHIFRDKLGIIPIGMVCDGSRAIVSSDHGWMLEVCDIPPRPNDDRLRWFITWCESTGRDDFYAEVERLKPREVVTWRATGQREIRPYWHPETTPLDDPRTARRRFMGAFEEVLDDTAARDPVVSMSGGLDSPTLAAALAARSSQPLEVVSQVAPGMPLVDEDDAIRDLEEILPIRVHRYDITDHLPLRNLELFERDFGLGPIHHGGERADVAMRRWMASRVGEHPFVLGVGAEVLVESPRSLALEYAVRSGSLDAWIRIARRRSPFMLALQIGRITSEALGVRDRLAPLYRSLRYGEDKLPSWRQPERWLLEPYPASHHTPPPSIGARKHHHLVEDWRWEMAHRGRARQARRSGTRSLMPYFDDRLWSIGLRLPAGETIDRWVLRQCARRYLPKSLAMRSDDRSFNPVGERSLVRWGRRHLEPDFDHSHLAKRSLIRDAPFRRCFRQCMRRIRRKSKLDQQLIPYHPLWMTLSAEYWLRQLER